MKSNTFVGREDAIDLFKLLVESGSSNVLPILIFTAPPGGGKTELIDHLYTKYCHSSKGGYSNYPCARIDFSKPEAPKKILDILTDLRNRLIQSTDKNHQRLIFPRFDLGLIFALAALDSTNGPKLTSDQIRQKILEDLSIFGTFGEVSDKLGNIGGLLSFVPLIGFLIRRGEKLDFLQDLTLKLKNGPSWEWYKGRLNLHPNSIDSDTNNTQHDITITSLFKHLFDMSTDPHEREELITRILPEALLEDIRSALDSKSSLAWEDTKNVVVFFDGFETLLDEPEDVGRKLLEGLTLSDRQKRDKDKLLIVVGSNRRLLAHETADSLFEVTPENILPQQRAKNVYSDWLGRLSPSKQLMRVRQKYLEFWLHDFSIDEIKKYFSSSHTQLENASLIDKRLSSIYHITLGHPLFLSLVASNLGEDLTYKDTREIASETHLLDQLLKGFSPEEQRKLLWCAVPRALDVDTVQETLQPFASRSSSVEAETLWNRYRNLTMFRSTGSGKLILHPVIRNLLLQRLAPNRDRRRDYYKVHSSLLEHFDRLTQDNNEAKLERVYHSLALGDTTYAIELAQHLQRTHSLQWIQLLQVVEQASNKLANKEEEKQKAFAMLKQAREQHDVESSVAAVILYTYLLSELDNLEGSELEHLLGNAYHSLAQNTSQERDTNQRWAIDHYRIALESYSVTTYPLENAKVNTDLGEVYFDILREHPEEISNQKDGENCYLNAMTLYSRERHDEELEDASKKFKEIREWKVVPAPSTILPPPNQDKELDKSIPLPITLPTSNNTTPTNSTSSHFTGHISRISRPFRINRTKEILWVGGVIFVIIAALLFTFMPNMLDPIKSTLGNRPTSNSATDLKLPPGITIGTFKAPDGEDVGISDGRFAFDTAPDRLDKNLKSQLPEMFKNNDTGQINALLQQATSIDTNDAEAKIYLEDQTVLTSGLKYVTIVVGITFQRPYPHGISRGILQGAYVAQHEYNQANNHPKGILLRLLIARSGSDTKYVAGISQQIVLAAKSDPTIIGVMGWPSSISVYNQIQTLASAHIPAVSSAAAADDLSNNLYFFRIAPPNTASASAAAFYAGKTLQAKRVALISDDKEPYSINFAKDFEQSFKMLGRTICRVSYTTRQPDQIQSSINKALQCNPDLIEFAISDTNDIKVALSLLPTSGKDANLPLMTGDSAYALVNTPGITKNFNRLYFASLAYPDEWRYLHLSDPIFFQEYAQAFNDTSRLHPVYGYIRSDGSSMEGYDAIRVVETGVQMALANNTQQDITRDSLQSALTQIKGSQAVQGVTGQISFNIHHDPDNKVTLVLHATNQGIQIVYEQGCFLKGSCG